MWPTFRRLRRSPSSERKKEKERLELALRGADLATWDWNVTTGEVVYNARWAEMRGYRAEDVSPNVASWADDVHPDDWPEVQRVLQDHFQGRRGEYETEHRVRTKSGTWLWILDRGKVFARDAHGNPTRMLGTELDISARKRAEEALRLSEARAASQEREARFLSEVSAVLASSLELQSTLTRIGEMTTRTIADLCIVYGIGESGEITRVRAVSGHPEHDWICDVLPQEPLDTARTPEIWSQLKANRPVLIKEITPELLVRWSQNEEHLRALRLLAPKSMLMMPLAAHGRVVGAMSLVSTRPQHVYTRADIGFAEQIAQRAAHALNSAQLYARAKRAIHARDTVLGIVAHDLRNPLTTILMQAALLHRAGSQPERRSRQPAETIERACRRMSRIIQDLLDVARIEEGQLSIERERVSPRQSIVEAIDAYAAAATVGGIELQLECAHELPQVWADRYRLLQILENLVSNALKFTPPGGTVRIGAARSSAEVLFSVADTGSGISPENLRHIFDRFWRLRRSDRTGLGLGLPIVKGLVEAHGGHVWAESAVDQGTTFFFTMPLAPRAQDRAATGPSV